ncbi:MAG: phosphoglucosamine mutase [Candidatus Thermoplasmatota archaeon]|nr:phosphoglucosamine mutase [Candidatus Thermoplasmatota archaeon]
MGRLFGTNGVRGISNVEMTPELAQHLGLACGTYLNSIKKPSNRRKCAIIGTDTRTSNSMIKCAFVSGILSTGCDIYDAGIITSPGLQYATRSFKMDFGVIITASHNPPEFNGIKCIDADGTELAPEQESVIEDIYFSGTFAKADWKSIGAVYPKPDAVQVYIDKVVSCVDANAIAKRRPKVVVDASNGAGSFTLPYILRKLGCEVISLNCQPDGMFPGHQSEPVEENVKDLMNTVKAAGADFGVVNDGDADRAVFIDENGKYITQDKELTLFAKLAVEEASKKKCKNMYVACPVAISMSTEEAIKPYGAKMVYTVIGSPKVARKMIELDAVFGGEANGGLIFPEMQYCRDGGMAAAKMAEIISKTGRKVSEMVAELPQWQMVQAKTKCPNEIKQKVIEEYAKSAKALKPESVDMQDGTKSYFKNGWVLARPSGTEPIYRVYAESKERKVAEKLLSDHIKMIEDLVAKLKV